MRRRDGFSLIEMLTVIAIIAVLAAIVFPVLARVRENGRRTRCVSNLKQFGVAFRLYANDNRGYAPYQWYGVRYGGYREGDVLDPLFDYVDKNWEVYYCPSDIYKEQNTGAPGVGCIGSSYGYNWWGPGNRPPQDGSYWKPVKLADIPPRPRPLSPLKPRAQQRDWTTYSKIYILDEFSTIAPNADRDGDGIRDCYQRHGRGSNLLLSDGSVYFCKGYDMEKNQGF